MTITEAFPSKTSVLLPIVCFHPEMALLPDYEVVGWRHGMSLLSTDKVRFKMVRPL